MAQEKKLTFPLPFSTLACILSAAGAVATVIGAVPIIAVTFCSRLSQLIVGAHQGTP